MKISFCTTKQKKVEIKMKTQYFVGMHELAHIMTVSGHKPEFWDNFRFLTIAKESGTYTPVDYKKVRYILWNSTDNPYFDL